MSELANPLTRARAEAMEEAFLDGLHDAQVHFEAIVAEQAWTALGFDTFGGWWAERVVPTMRALSMKPTRELAGSVVELVREEEAELPPTWRRTQAQLAEMVGVERSSLANRDGSRSPQCEESRGSDLGGDTSAVKMAAQMPARQDFAEAFAAQLDDAMQRRAEIEAHNAHMAEVRADLTPERIAEITAPAQPAVHFTGLAEACRFFLSGLDRIDLATAAAGYDPTKAGPVRDVLNRLDQIREALGVQA